MEEELLDALTRVKCSDATTAIFGNPVNSVCTDKNDQLIISWALDHSVYDSNILIRVGDIISLLGQYSVETLP